jgi:hypothetical protein
MTSTVLLRQVRRILWIHLQTNLPQRIAPAAAGILAVGITLFPRTVLTAEAPERPEVRLMGPRNSKRYMLTPFAAQKAYL